MTKTESISESTRESSNFSTHRLVLRSSFQRATYFFSMKTIFRFEKHCMLFGTATAVGTAKHAVQECLTFSRLACRSDDGKAFGQQRGQVLCPASLFRLQDTPVQVYTAYLQKPGFLAGAPPAMTVLARTVQDPALLGAPMKAAILNMDHSQPVYAVQPMTAVVSQSIAQRRLSLILLAFFALTALFLASLGLYGVMSYFVVRRTNEIGIGMALGAARSGVVAMVVRGVLWQVLIGFAFGIPAALFTGHLMSKLLFGVRGYDPLALLGAILLLAICAGVAGFIPSSRAASIDPMQALRYE